MFMPCWLFLMCNIITVWHHAAVTWSVCEGSVLLSRRPHALWVGCLSGLCRRDLPLTVNHAVQVRTTCACMYWVVWNFRVTPTAHLHVQAGHWGSLQDSQQCGPFPFYPESLATSCQDRLSSLLLEVRGLLSPRCGPDCQGCPLTARTRWDRERIRHKVGSQSFIKSSYTEKCCH